MPRIAAALAVAATLAFCIGFNTIRYPAVWEMIAPSDHAVPSAEAAVATAKPSAAAESTAATIPGAWPVDRPLALPSSPPVPPLPAMPSSWAEGAGMPRPTPPIEMTPSARVGSAQASAALPAAGPVSTPAARAGAPVWVPDRGPDPLLSLGASDTRTDTGTQTRRLPPVEQTASAEPSLSLPAGSLPLYPTTHAK
jgi:hypothetical protein